MTDAERINRTHPSDVYPEEARQSPLSESACYVLIVTYPYEFSRVLGVYSTEEKAIAAKGEAETKDESDGYNDFEIEEFLIT